MNRNMVLTALVAATVLVQFAGVAAAGSYEYDVPIGMTKDYLVHGENPRLDEDAAVGDARIVDVDPLAGGFKVVWVECLGTSSVDCLGFILTDSA